ncbi:hypothetical protein WDW86_03200 [Bdellovibrionota bacterium FG-2]
MLYYYRSKSRRRIDLIAGESEKDLTAYQILESERVPGTELEILKAFRRKVPGTKLRVFSPQLEPDKTDGIELLPWERIAVG